MRLPLPVRPKGRDPQDETRVPVKIMRPIKLRDRVSGRGSKGDHVACLQEMQVMMACFKTNDFIETPCMKEIAKFQTCVEETNKVFKEREAMLKKGVIVGAKKLNHLQVNAILQKFPSK